MKRTLKLMKEAIGYSAAFAGIGFSLVSFGIPLKNIYNFNNAMNEEKIVRQKARADC